MRLCNAPTLVHGAYGCPRTAGHRGEHLWWLTWEDEAGLWRVICYSGDPYDRVKRARGVFSEPPEAADVHALLRTLSPLRKREQARRTPLSAPQPPYRALPVKREGRVLVGA